MKNTTIINNGYYIQLNNVLKQITYNAFIADENGTKYYYNNELVFEEKRGEEFDVYCSYEEYKDGVSCVRYGLSRDSVLINERDFPVQVDGDGELCINAWVMSDSGMVWRKFIISAILNNIGSNHCNTATLEMDEGLELYKDREDFLAYNAITKVESDGTSETYGGEYGKMRLTKEQMEIVEELRDLLAKCKNAKIGVVMETCNCELLAYNKEHHCIAYEGNGGIRYPDVDFPLEYVADVDYFNADDYCSYEAL